MRVEVDVLGSQPLIVMVRMGSVDCMGSVDVKQH